jgi:hypothetical protein
VNASAKGSLTLQEASVKVGGIALGLLILKEVLREHKRKGHRV